MSENEVTIETQEVPLEESNMVEFKKARAEGKETATRETIIEQEKPPSDEKPKVKGGFQARIDRLIKHQAALEEQKSAAEKRAEELEAKLNGKGSETQKENGEPKREDYQTDAEYVRALTRWEVKQEIKAEREAEERQKVESEVKEARNRYNARMIALQEETPEYKELMNQAIQVPTSIEVPVTQEMENGPEVVIFLAQNPEICEELTQMSPSRAVAEVWRISEKLAAGNEDEEEQEKVEEEAPKAKAVEEKPKPRPIRPVSSGTSRSTIPLDKADYQAYKKLRAQGRVQ